MTTEFESWEIPTGGEPPPIRVYYDEQDGRRKLMNASAWILLIRRASGAIEPIGRHALAWLDAGDELLSPMSRTEPIDSKVVFRAQMNGIREYGEANHARFDDEGNIRAPAPEPERWWWYRRELPYGRVIHLHAASSNARLSISMLNSLGFEGSWCYPNHSDGWAAALGWNGEGDPPDGWIRHLETARRRKDGTAESEFIYAYEQAGR